MLTIIIIIYLKMLKNEEKERKSNFENEKVKKMTYNLSSTSWLLKSRV